jgi:Undecaprenyl-phosphate glucose phosphotransferase
MSTISMPIITGFIRFADWLLMMLSGLLATYGLFHLTDIYPEGQLRLATVAGASGAALFLARDGAYTVAALASFSSQLRLFLVPLIIGGICVILCLFILPEGRLPSRAWPVVWMLCSLALLGFSRLYICSVVRHWGRTGRLARKVAIVGVGEFSREFILRLRDEPNAFHIVGVYDDRMARVPDTHAGIAVRGTVADLLQRSREETIDVIVVALPLSAVERIKRILEELGSAVADICLTTDLAGLHFSGDQFEGLGRNPVVSVRERPLKDWKAFQKLVLDYLFASIALVGLSPFLIAIAVLIRLDSPGPILFRQPRMGFNNKMFLCYKFRTMHHGMTDVLADRQTTRDDPRVTRVGKYLRKFSLDELPQLLNVLRGSMSLVGPRPHAPNTKAADQLFADVVQQYAVRHRVKPGITGWAQVNGWRGETKTVDQIEQRVACDLFYIEHWTIWLDLKIMAMTVLREVNSRHAF